MTYLLHQNILEQAEKAPDHIAFRCGKEEYAYADLAVKMQQLAAVLQDSGVRRGDRVGIFLHRCLETSLAIYGILQAGAVYVPIDPTLPEERIRYLIQDCGIQCLVSHPSQRRRLAVFGADEGMLRTIIGLEAEWAVPTISWEAVWSAPLAQAPRQLEKDLAYIIYTSGSTGNPKGVMHTHYSGLTYARLTADLYDIRSTDRIGNHAPIFFDISTLGYLTTPLVGATTVISSDAHVMLPTSLAKLIEQERLTIWYSVPLALIQMVQTQLLPSLDWSALRWILYGGEPFALGHLRQLMAELPHVGISNVYGPTETNQCTFYNLPAPPVDDTPVPIGYLWGNTEMLILDEDDQPVSDGEPGELLIRSGTMMKGYWNNPERTKQSFYEHTAVSGMVHTFYRTGDLVLLDENGLLQLLGRKDRQIKARGYRVELDEVEIAILSHPQVREAAVFPKAAADGQSKTIAAAISWKEELPIPELIGFLKQKLPPYAVPEDWTKYPELPRTPTGKIDRKLLQKVALQK
ncbi:MAG: amino acid adenylation domain-containing protein [Bacteroidota bacterium]